jgi:hypothetical protein
MIKTPSKLRIENVETEKVSYVKKKLTENFVLIGEIFFYCCAGWRYTVAFTKVLTVYQIYHT